MQKSMISTGFVLSLPHLITMMASASRHDPADPPAAPVATTTTTQKDDPSSDADVVVSSVNERIVNGVEVSPKYKYPWFAGIEFESGFVHCGGSLVHVGSHSTPGFILSAAHCFNGKDHIWQTWRVRLNPHERSYSSGYFTRPEDIQMANANNIPYTPNVVRQIEGAILHPEYQAANFMRDLAVVRLVGPTFAAAGERVATITLRADTTPLPAGKDMTVMGFGHLRFGAGATFPTVLQEVHVPTVSPEQCLKSYPWLSSYVHSVVVCAGYWEGNMDACSGDSGGPLVYRSDATEDGTEQEWILAGLVSFGDGCAAPGKYGAYAMLGNIGTGPTAAGFRLTDWVHEQFIDVPTSPSPFPDGGGGSGGEGISQNAASVNLPPNAAGGAGKSEADGGANSAVMIGAAAGGAAVLFVVILIVTLCCCCKKRHFTDTPPPEQGLQPPHHRGVSGTHGSHSNYPYEMEMATSPAPLINREGGGGFFPPHLSPPSYFNQVSPQVSPQAHHRLMQHTDSRHTSPAAGVGIGVHVTPNPCNHHVGVVGSSSSGVGGINYHHQEPTRLVPPSLYSPPVPETGTAHSAPY